MKYTWDEEKYQANLSKHGLDFADASEVFNGPILEALDVRRDYGEDRWIGIGSLRGRIVVLVYTELEEQTIRIISMRKAITHEQENYYKFLQDKLGTT